MENLLSKNPDLEIPADLSTHARDLLGRIIGQANLNQVRSQPKSLADFKSAAPYAESNEFLNCPVCTLPILLKDYPAHSNKCRKPRGTLELQRKLNRAPTPIEKLPSVSESGPEVWHRPNRVANLKVAKPPKDDFISDTYKGKELLIDPFRSMENKLDASKDQWYIRDHGKYGSMSAHDDHAEEGEV